MADSKISALPTADALTGAELIPIVQDGITKKIAVEDLPGSATVIDGGSASVPDVKQQLRRDTSTNWTSNNPTLLSGEQGLETDTNRRKTGPGAWNSLNYDSAPRVVSITSSTTPTPNCDTTDQYNITALAGAATFGAPTGTPSGGQKLIIRIKDNGTARALSFNSVFRFSSDLTAPTTTIISKTMYLGFIYNSTDSKWDCVAILDNL